MFKIHEKLNLDRYKNAESENNFFSATSPWLALKSNENLLRAKTSCGDAYAKLKNKFFDGSMQSKCRDHILKKFNATLWRRWNFYRCSKMHVYGNIWSDPPP